MTTEQTLPGAWTLESEQTIHDEFMGRTFSTVLYRQTDTRQAVYINEVIDGRNVWQYRVHHSGPGGDIGTADDMEAAKRMAVAYIEESDAGV